MTHPCIISRPDWNDTATLWGQWWTLELEKKLAATGLFDIHELYKEQATKGPNEDAIKEWPNALYYGFGHGNSTVFTGQKMLTIIDNNNVELWNVGPAFVHLLSCEVFAGLGKKFLHGSGYAKTFYFYTTTHPNSVAEMYFDSDQQWMLEIAKGAMTAEAQKVLKAKFDYWLRNGPPYGNDYLMWDKECHTITGDPDARLQPTEGIISLKAYFNEVSESNLIGDFKKELDNFWELDWKIPVEGMYKLIYVGEDTEGGRKEVATGDFEVRFPPSGINIVPVSPKGGEVFTARALKIQIEAWYEKS